ncbi:MAG: hypothetical protein ACREQ5_05090 [Candidatus Dormibacteria bacterium]
MALSLPPTYALPIDTDPTTKQDVFNPVWLKWFLDVAQVIKNGALQSGVVNAFNGRQGLVILGSSDVTGAIGYTPANVMGAATQVFSVANAVTAQEAVALNQLTPEAATTPTFLNSWVDFGGANQTTSFYKDPAGIVHLRGLVKSGTIGTAIFALPNGYRPTATEFFAVPSNSAFGLLLIDSSGNVVADDGSNVWFSLAGITFRTV